MEAINAYRLQSATILWDTNSQYPWQHMEALAEELNRQAVPSDDWHRFVKEGG